MLHCANTHAAKVANCCKHHRNLRENWCSTKLEESRLVWQANLKIYCNAVHNAKAAISSIWLGEKKRILLFFFPNTTQSGSSEPSIQLQLLGVGTAEHLWLQNCAYLGQISSHFALSWLRKILKHRNTIQIKLWNLNIYLQNCLHSLRWQISGTTCPKKLQKN